MVGNNKHLALFCALAFLFVFAHSAIPHDHHFFCPGEHTETQHETHSHYGSCDELDLFLINNLTRVDAPDLCPDVFLYSVSLELDEVKGFSTLTLNNDDPFLCKAPPLLLLRQLRAPPTV